MYLSVVSCSCAAHIRTGKDAAGRHPWLVTRDEVAQEQKNTCWSSELK